MRRLTRRRTLHFLITLALVVTFTGCAGTGRALVASGEGLKTLGNEFVVVAEQFKRGCDVTKTLTPAQCAKFRDFGENFKKVYPLTIRLWESARQAGDAASEKKARDVITSLSSSLAALAVEAFGTFGGVGK